MFGEGLFGDDSPKKKPSRKRTPFDGKRPYYGKGNSDIIHHDDEPFSPLEYYKDHHDKSIMRSMKHTLPQEDDEGFVEYKLKLCSITKDRFKHLVTQMKFRISEGSGEAVYEIGVSDDGMPIGLTPKEFNETVKNLKNMAAELKADLSILCEKTVEEGKKVAELLVRKFGDDNYVDLRIAALGNVDSGKSTLVGVLCNGELDNGRGKARTHVFQHKHEFDSGRTSSVCMQIMGFDSKGKITNYSHFGVPSWKEIVEKSAKICTFIDLAGHEKYLKTTVFGMSSAICDYAVLMVAANNGVNHITRQHLGLCLSLRIPVFCIITKIDICPPKKFKETYLQLKKILQMPGVRKLPVPMETHDDVLSAAQTLGKNRRICPIFTVSNVTGENMDLLRTFLNILPLRKDWRALEKKKATFYIDKRYEVQGVGTVVSGLLSSGIIKTHDVMRLGPDSSGGFVDVKVKSIQIKHVNVRKAIAGQFASIAFSGKVKRHSIRKGMILTEREKPKATLEFEADVLVLFHKNFKVDYEPVISSRFFQQSARILSMKPAEGDDRILQTGDKARVRFRFLHRPEYLMKGQRIVMREGNCKGIGSVVVPFFDKHQETSKEELQKKKKSPRSPKSPPSPKPAQPS